MKRKNLSNESQENAASVVTSSEWDKNKKVIYSFNSDCLTRRITEREHIMCTASWSRHNIWAITILNDFIGIDIDELICCRNIAHLVASTILAADRMLVEALCPISDWTQIHWASAANTIFCFNSLLSRFPPNLTWAFLVVWEVCPA